ncbi:MAG: flagellar brake protein [Rhodocyclaceae bacterium]|nr:flagellar brake protein [Rhodocyclaceae bacterium]
MAEPLPTDKPADAPPAEKKPPLLEPGDYAQFLLRSQSEIVYVLKSLLEHVSQITIFFNEGKDLLLTTLVALEDDGLLLDLGASSETNRKALTVEKLFCVASLEKVRIQFLLRGLTQTTFEGRPAFRAALPTDLLRLQRREFFRLTMPITRPLKCQIPITEGESGNSFVVDVNVVDISGGGLAIALPEGIDFDPEKEFPNCRIELPEVGVVTTTLKVRNQFEITLRSGGRVRRAGCEFVKLPGPMLTLVQRYIIKIERERKARESGMI